MSYHQSRWIDWSRYRLEVHRKVEAPAEAPRLIMVAHLRNATVFELTKLCIQSVQRFTVPPYELWVVVHAPNIWSEQLQTLEGVNVVINHTLPMPRRKISSYFKFGKARNNFEAPACAGSYANAIGLEIGVRLINPASRFLFVMHNDAIACADGWLNFLMGKIEGNLRGVATREDKIRVHAMHVSGFLVDFQLYHRLGMSFIPKLPVYDTGDQITLKLREHGLAYHVCPNTYNHPALAERVPASHPLYAIRTELAFDDGGRAIFAHLGRGTPKATGHYWKEGKTGAEEWIQCVQKHLGM